MSSNVNRVTSRPIERRKIPSATSMKARQNACSVIHPFAWPFARRLAIENGTATPTMNENDG